jgi:hypothetical protein
LTGRGEHAVRFLDVGAHFLQRNDFIAVGIDVVEARSQVHIAPRIILGQETLPGAVHLSEQRHVGLSGALVVSRLVVVRPGIHASNR